MICTRSVKNIDRNVRNKYLITNADDLGLCRSVNQASLEALKKGCVTSLSIMPCGPRFMEAIVLAKKNKILDMGVHLTLTSEFPKLRWGPVSDKALTPSLIDREGYLHRTIDAFARLARTQEIALELENQILKVIRHGILPTHLDCHMFSLHDEVSKRRDLIPLVIGLCKKYKLPFRCPFKKEHNVLKKNSVRFVANSFKESYDIPPRLKMGKYNAFIKSIKTGLSEMILHCGYDNEELKAITGCSKRRQVDFDYAVSAKTKDLLNKLSITPVSWREASRYL